MDIREASETIHNTEVEGDDAIDSIRMEIIRDKPTARKNTADYLLDKHSIYTLTDTKQILYYDKGYYHNDATTELTADINRIWMSETTTHCIKEIFGAHIKPRTYLDRGEFNQDINKTCLLNGVLDLRTLEFSEHTPEHKFTFQLPVEYHPDAECPMIELFLENIIDKDNIPLMYQIIGYCLWRDYPIHKAVMLVGDGSNGKSTFINLVEAFIGEDNVSHIAIQTLINNRFAASNLHNKHANLYPDLEYTALKSTGLFKIVTGGDRLHGEKKFQDGFSFKNHAKIIYSANKLPEVQDTTTAFFRRWTILNFPNTFDDNQADKHMIDKITTPEELSGLLLKAVIGLQRLLDDGKFTRSETTDEIEDKYMKLSNSIAAFVNEVLEPDQEAPIISRRELFHTYQRYCRDNDLLKKNQAALSKELSAYIDVADARLGNERAWKGIRIKNERYSSTL